MNPSPTIVATTSSRRRTLLLALVTTVATLVLLASAVLLANMAPGAGWMLLLLAVPLTVGLPTTLAALACVTWWNGPPLPVFVGLCLVTGVAAQYSSMRFAQHMRRRRPG